MIGRAPDATNYASALLAAALACGLFAWAVATHKKRLPPAK
jgi:hypothetical protein